MARLEGKGRPTRKTLGALGDIYKDINTGAHYICTFAYRSGSEGDFDCEWKPHNGISLEDTQPVKKVETDSVYGEFKNKPKLDVIPKVEVEDVPDEAIVAESESESVPQPAPKRKDYSSYAKKNR